MLRRHVRISRPLGSIEFIERLGNLPVGAYAWQSRDASQADRATTLRIRFRYCVPRIPLKIGDELLCFVALLILPWRAADEERL